MGPQFKIIGQKRSTFIKNKGQLKSKNIGQIILDPMFIHLGPILDPTLDPILIDFVLNWLKKTKNIGFFDNIKSKYRAIW